MLKLNRFQLDFFLAGCPAIALLALVLSAAHAAEPAVESPSPKAPADGSAAVVENRGGLDDPAFEAYVPEADIGIALYELNPARILDMALLTAEGERVLGRPRKGISADALMALAIATSIERLDRPTLARLSKVAAAREDTVLQARLQKAAETSPDAARAKRSFTIDLADHDLIAISEIKASLAAIERATILQDRDALETLEKRLAEHSHMTAAECDSLRERIADARKKVPEASGATEGETLQKLNAVSRGYSLPNISLPKLRPLPNVNIPTPKIPKSMQWNPGFNPFVDNSTQFSEVPYTKFVRSSSLFVYDTGYFQQQPDRRCWIEHRRDGSQSFFQTVRIDPYSVTLYDSSRRIFVRLQEGHSDWSYNQNGPFNPWTYTGDFKNTTASAAQIPYVEGPPF